MDSEALKTFITIHRTEGFSNAAQALRRTQPAISRRIALLEEELKVPLFERTGAGVVLSQAGHVLLPYAERALAALEDAANAVEELRTGSSGPVSVAIVGTLASTTLTPALKRFAAQFPKVALSLRTATSGEVSALVRGGEATIGLRYHDDGAADLVSDFVTGEQLLVVCSRKHRLAGKGVRTLRDLRNEHWVAFPNLVGRREASAQTIHREFLARGVGEFPWTPVDSLTAQKRLVEAGYGIALIPRSAIHEEQAAKTIATIAVRDLDARNPIYTIVRKDGYLSDASRRLIDLIRSEWTLAEKKK